MLAEKCALLKRCEMDMGKVVSARDVTGSEGSDDGAQ